MNEEQRACGGNERSSIETGQKATSVVAPISPLRDADAWLFDLDNTLYSASIDLFSQIDARMRGYIAELLGVDQDAAYALQKQYFAEFGTSMRGLMERHGMDPAAFLDHVHDIDVSVLAPADALGRALAALPGRKIVFTNASTAHAERVLKRLCIDHHFCGVFDIFAADFRPKPEPDIYRTVVERHAIDPRRSVMVEDMARNLAPAAAMGMTTVWVRTNSEWGAVGADAGYIHFMVDDLAEWLTDVADGTI
ncbi:MAG: pyrimidine 5'-nucleotidase [Rhodospirillales bacterium]|nr:pyrimidine 5'-nucleotidase [Rhodospirillales bacterium]